MGVQLAEAGKEHRGVHLVEFLFLGFAGGACSGAQLEGGVLMSQTLMHGCDAGLILRFHNPGPRPRTSAQSCHRAHRHRLLHPRCL